MPFNRPTLQNLIDRATSDIATRMPGADALVRRSNLFVLARVHSGAMHELYGELDWLSRQLLPDTCDDPTLLRWANIFLSVPQKAATFAAGQVALLGTSGALIAAGTVLQRGDGAQFTVDANATIVLGAAVANVTAVLAGAAGNSVAGTQLALVSPIAGVTSTATVAVGGDISNGFDIEASSAVRMRLLARLRQPAQGGAAADYVNWALSVPGVTRAWCVPGAVGSGAVGVCLVSDTVSGGLRPSAATLAATQAYLNTVRPVTAGVTAFAPVPDAVNFSIRLVPSNVTTQAAVTAQLVDLFNREATPGGSITGLPGVPAGTLLLSHIQQAVGLAAGVTDYTVTAPAANVVSISGHMPVMGAVTWL